MESRLYYQLCAIIAVLSVAFARHLAEASDSTSIQVEDGIYKPFDMCNVTLRGDLQLSYFPKDFVWGAGASAGQVEGAAALDGRTPSAWDVFSSMPGKIIDCSNASVACDSYHCYEEDVRLLAKAGMKSYRFSLSWSRILPNGGNEVNPKGIEYYNNLINSLIANGIEPLVTIHHMDLPLDIERQGGWLNRSIVHKYSDYAETCFRFFGDRVKTWVTLNEPYHVAVFGFSNGEWPPARCSNRMLCQEGNSSIEMYQAMHNMLLSHALIVDIYRSKYQGRSGGQIGINIEGPYFYPYDHSPETLSATERAFSWRFGWAWEPIYSGDYPAVMREELAWRLPKFTSKEKEMLKGSADYFGLNFYTGVFIKYKENRTYLGTYDEEAENDGHFLQIFFGADGEFIGPRSGFFFRPQVPSAMYDILMWITTKYPEFPILITENGFAMTEQIGEPLSVQLCDASRVTFFQNYLASVQQAIQDGALVKGFFMWSLLDSFEWAYGYTVLHGMAYVDFKDPKRTRYERASHYWWASFIRGDFDQVASF